ncbi:MAG TPA: AarF/UbiB family protein [Gemmatimonadaceae bacterium]|nr:AarF/UbiB family protein [Gemmatimonadaceae bacterium]
MHTLRVLIALAPLGLSFLRDHRRWWFFGRGLARDPAFHRRRAERLVTAVVRLGPSFVKIAQVFASRADLVPEPYLSALGSLVDQVPPMPFAHVEATIREAYGRDVDEVFEAFEREPVAAASLAQVHRARVAGQAVAVKVLRPGVEVRVAADVAAARRILGWLDRWWGHPHIKRELTALAAFEVRVREEVNFVQEAEYATTIRNNFAGNPHLVIPRVFAEYTRRRVLVMEFVEGTRIDRLDPARVDVTRIVQTLVELYVQMELIDGLFHADPHPGNVMVAPDGRLVLVDFGAVVRVPLAMRRALVHTSIAAIRRDADGVVQGFTDMGLVPPGTNRQELRAITQTLIGFAYSRSTVRERIDSLLANRVMQALFDSPVTLTQEAVYFARAAALIEGIGTRYDPYFQVVPVASPVVLRMRSRILTSLGEHVTPNAEEIATVAGYALGRAARWVTDWVDRTITNRNGAARKTAGALVLALMAGLASGCASGGRATLAAAPHPAAAITRIDTGCDACAPAALAPEVSAAIERRVAALDARGGDCRAYGTVLAHALADGKISVKPFMWRVGANLAAGTAHPEGDMTVAMNIDSLNVGLRTLDDVIESVEHEAAHLAFQDLPRDPTGEAAVERKVRACRS